MAHLKIAEAVPLGYAMVARVAHDAGVRALSIKGPIPHANNVAPPKVSNDVDVWVDPAMVQQFHQVLMEAGWNCHDGEHEFRVLEPHSTTFRCAAWPLEIDVHTWIPGILTDPGEAFEIFWRRRTVVRVAECDLNGAGPASSVVLGHLHDIRNRRAFASSFSKLRSQLRSDAELRADFLELEGQLELVPLRRSIRFTDLGKPGLFEWYLRTYEIYIPGLAKIYRVLSAPRGMKIQTLAAAWRDMRN